MAKLKDPVEVEEAETTKVLVRMSQELVDNLDTWVEKLNKPKKEGEPKWTRTHLIVKLARAGWETKGIKGEEP